MNETLVIKPLQNSLQQLLVMYDFMRNKMVIAGMVPLRDQNPIWSESERYYIIQYPKNGQTMSFSMHVSFGTTPPCIDPECPTDDHDKQVAT